MNDRFVTCEQHCGAHRESCGEPSSVLLVGEDNPVSSEPAFALWFSPPNCAGHRLQSKILGIGEEEYLATWRVNLCADSWSKREALTKAQELLRGDHPWELIVMLGRKVAQAFAPHGIGELTPFSHAYAHGRFILSLPHPSGRNLIWNEAAAVEGARRQLRELAPGVTWGGAT